MTHQTDEELDAQFSDEVEVALDPIGAWRLITSLHTQLADANARADRAEAALAAQIEADAGIADLCERQNGPLSLKDQDPYVQGLSSAGQAIAAAIRAQPHDRTALDRMLAEHEVRLREAREKALRDAAAVCDKNEQVSGWVSRDAILALSEKDKEN